MLPSLRRKTRDAGLWALAPGHPPAPLRPRGRGPRSGDVSGDAGVFSKS